MPGNSDVLHQTLVRQHVPDEYYYPAKKDKRRNHHSPASDASDRTNP